LVGETRPPRDGQAASPSTVADGDLVLECDIEIASVQYNAVLGNASATYYGFT